MALHDGGWGAARWLVLLPPEAIGAVASPDEEEIARRVEAKELRPRGFLKRAHRLGVWPGGWRARVGPVLVVASSQLPRIK